MRIHPPFLLTRMLHHSYMDLYRICFLFLLWSMPIEILAPRVAARYRYPTHLSATAATSLTLMRGVTVSRLARRRNRILDSSQHPTMDRRMQ